MITAVVTISQRHRMSNTMKAWLESAWGHTPGISHLKSSYPGFPKAEANMMTYMQGDLCMRWLGKEAQKEENSNVNVYFLSLFRVLELDSMGFSEKNKGWCLSSTYCVVYFLNSVYYYIYLLLLHFILFCHTGRWTQAFICAKLCHWLSPQFPLC